MIHRIQQRVAIEHVDIHVVARATEKGIEYVAQIRDSIFLSRCPDLPVLAKS